MERLETFFFIVIILCGVGFAYYYYYAQDEFDLKCIISTVDGNKYCVRERERETEAADKLARTTQKAVALVQYMNRTHGDDPRVQKLVAGFNPKRVNETLPTSTFTAFSENKGEKTAFCLNRNSKQDNSTLIDDHTLMFVAIHELAHDMTTSIGHEDDFWENFKFLLENAKAAGIHEPKDYKEEPEKYCGMTIQDNPYFDL